MKLTSFITLIIILCSCSFHDNEGIDYKAMFEKAMKNQSTSPNYIVINAIDLNTNEKKEICCESIDLSYALTLNSNRMNLDSIEYDSSGIPIFEFKSIKALNQIRFYRYKVGKVDSLIKYTDSTLIDSILKENDKIGYSKVLELYTSAFSEHYFEHFLYKKGILTHRDCESGFTIISNEK